MSKKLHEGHKELMHYTNASGLYGIVRSKTLWASHTSFMNDSEEGVGYFNRVLPMILRPALEKHVSESKDHAKLVKKARQLGVDKVDIWLRSIVEGLKKAEKAQDHYVSSFCTTENEWIIRNGLLSQWRGYGPDGGYAIVFDAARLDSLLVAECEIYYEERLIMTDVQYDMADLSEVKDEQCLININKVMKGMFTFLTTGDHLDTEVQEAIESNSVLSILCKHRGFEEEKEVRIVVSEPSIKIGPDPSNQSGKSYRKVKSYLRNGVPVPCVHLFEDQKLDSLTIRRVIVGPHPEKSDRKCAVEVLLRNHNIDAEVLESDTPFRGK